MDLESLRQINIKEFDTSSVERKFLVSYNKRYFEVNEAVVQLIELYRNSNSFNEIASKLSSLREGSSYNEDDIASLYSKYINPIIETDKKKKEKFFLWEKELIPSQIVDFFSQILRVLFFPAVIKILIVAAILTEIFFFYNNAVIFSVQVADAYIIVVVLLLYLCSSFLHELGHATACKYFGANHGGIGIGLYLNFPVFYTDVSEVWTLSRKQRMLVNFAGIYFQLISLIPLFLIFFITKSEVIKFFIFTLNFNFVITLNPFFRFDGYWIMSDLLGVPNLRTRSKDFFSFVLKKLKRKKVDKKPFFLTIKNTEKVTFIIYSLIVNLFFLYYFAYILPRFLGMFIKYFPERLSNLLNVIIAGQVPPFGLIFSVFSQLLMFGFMIFFIYKIMIKWLKKIPR
jgi:putative peptide zinc metalloprotease protein